MTNLAEHIIVAGAENRPPMLEKSIYDSWASLIRLFIKGKKHGRMMLDLIDNGPMMTDVQATNIILHGLPPDVYALVNHQEVAKDIWDKVKQLMKGTELSYEERECRLYNLFDKLASVQGETFKFVTDVKLAKSLYTTKYDQLYAYLNQHERHAQEVCVMRERYPDLLALQGEDPIDCINKAIVFLSAVASRGRAHGKIVHSAKEAKKFCVVQGEVDDLDAYNSDCDDISSAKAVLMANLSSCDADVLSEVPYSDTYLNDMINQEESKDNRNAKFAAFQQEIDTLKETLSNQLSQIKEYFGKHFVTQKELSAEQAFWLKHSNYNPDTSVKSHTPVRIEASSKLPKTRVQSKEQSASLIAQINAKSVENSDLNAQLQEKVFAIAALKNELRKLKGKNIVDTAVSKPSATIALEMFKLDIEPISHRLRDNRCL
ncbi:hypothetical protein Tco_1102925 [Tanacetum coccineum]